MLGWLSGNTQRAGSHAPKEDNGNSSYIEEPPETPAPVFAVRAFKTALFGTPHPNQTDATVVEEKVGQETSSKPKSSPPAKFTTPKTGSKSHASRAHKLTPFISPAKGILLTPGTAANRRKTVSFGNLDGEDGTKPEQSGHVAQPTISGLEKVSDTVLPEQAEVNLVSQPAFRKKLFETQLDASKQRLNAHQTSPETSASKDTPADSVPHDVSFPAQYTAADTTVDFTVDLTKPRSQSGQHWKAEYERYQRNSDRELKKIIQHGRNVKSYAEKKDTEATNLQERVQHELAKCAAMEAKVSKLAMQLANGRSNGPDGPAEQGKLMDDLSQQTALAIRYKQRADRYRIAIKQQTSSSVNGMSEDDRSALEDLSVDIRSAANGASGSVERNEKSELKALRSELDTLRGKLNVAEERAAKLEAVNAKLTRNFLRVKDEMQNYDARRVRKETRLKQREEALVAEKKASDAKLKLLRKEHEELLRSTKDNPVNGRDQELLLPESPRRQKLSRSRTSPLPRSKGELNRGNNFDDAQVNKSIQPDSGAHVLHGQVKPASKGAAIDIWTMDTPNDSADMTPPAAEPAINLSHVALSGATHHALREIDSNSVSDIPSEPALPPDTPRPTLEHLARMNSALQPDFPSSEPYQSSAIKRMNDRRNTMASPRPSMVNIASSVVKDEGTPRALGLRQNVSLVSRVGSRRSTLSGGRSRLGELPPDRAAAAKARLAQRKSMKENRQG
ncbi:MAG: hypothetical protein LQ343_000250 [Gyalolechia ehrenbergii]|nr:MAG: hypothetical protein LQ343_000250 [Gyalolechia ehrenbergii]